jgi:hypothetical protein
MDNTQSAHGFQALEAIAELLLWAGWDRAADQIYATIYGADALEPEGQSFAAGTASNG